MLLSKPWPPSKNCHLFSHQLPPPKKFFKSPFHKIVEMHLHPPPLPRPHTHTHTCNRDKNYLLWEQLLGKTNAKTERWLMSSRKPRAVATCRFLCPAKLILWISNLFLHLVQMTVIRNIFRWIIYTDNLQTSTTTFIIFWDFLMF